MSLLEFSQIIFYLTFSLGAMLVIVFVVAVFMKAMALMKKIHDTVDSLREKSESIYNYIDSFFSKSNFIGRFFEKSKKKSK